MARRSARRRSILSLTVDETQPGANATPVFATTSRSIVRGRRRRHDHLCAGRSAGPTGLFDTATGAGGEPCRSTAAVVEGRTAGSATSWCSRCRVDASGTVTLDQTARGGAPDQRPERAEDAVCGQSGDADGDITDKDGDSASATQTIGQNLVFEDDGPTITATDVDLSLTVDETEPGDQRHAVFAAAFTLIVRRRRRRHDHLCAGRRSPGPSGLFDTATGQAVNLVRQRHGRRRPHGRHRTSWCSR